jgi:CheY-like chemotaxis protein
MTQNSNSYKNVKTIWLADDDEDDQKIFADALEEAGLEVKFQSVYNGNELLILLNDPNHTPPDILFLDINMPQKNGMQCLAEIRMNKNLRILPIVIYSTSSFPPNIEETFQKGANLYFMKPNSFIKLKKNILTIVNLDWKKIIQNGDFAQFIFSRDDEN